MRAVIQRVSKAAVEVGGATVAEIDAGLVVLVAVEQGDGFADAEALADKLANLRVMSDEHGRMNLSLLDTGGSALVVSQFTLLGAVRRGRRPSFDAAAAPEEARGMVESVVEGLRRNGVPVSSGVFGAKMRLRLVNEGPVTLVIEVRDSHVL
jgi:D-tyrosyl-tRNA(Tyr) deacylase